MPFKMNFILKRMNLTAKHNRGAFIPYKEIVCAQNKYSETSEPHIYFRNTWYEFVKTKIWYGNLDSLISFPKTMLDSLMGLSASMIVS